MSSTLSPCLEGVHTLYKMASNPNATDNAAGKRSAAPKRSTPAAAAAAAPTASTSGSAGNHARKDGGAAAANANAAASANPLEPGNSFSVDIDLFSEECDLRVNNYRQAIHEEPAFPWTFKNPSKADEAFKFHLTLRSDPPHGAGGSSGSGRHAPRIYINWVGTIF